MTLMVFFSSRISPFTSTVIFLDRSPLATAVVTRAMLRTWPVRLPAIELTLSVRSFQVPDTSLTSAWPPNLPSVPTSRATRVTSEEKVDSWSTMTLMVFFSSRISPFTSTVIFFDRSPLAIAVATSAMLRTWPVRLPAIELTLSVRSFQVPATPFTCAWPPNLPSVPTSRATRVTSEEKVDSWSTMVLMVFFSSRISPFTSTVIFFDRSPLAIAVATSAMLRTWPVRLPAIELTLSVRSFLRLRRLLDNHAIHKMAIKLPQPGEESKKWTCFPVRQRDRLPTYVMGNAVCIHSPLKWVSVGIGITYITGHHVGKRGLRLGPGACLEAAVEVHLQPRNRDAFSRALQQARHFRNRRDPERMNVAYAGLDLVGIFKFIESIEQLHVGARGLDSDHVGIQCGDGRQNVVKLAIAHRRVLTRGAFST